MTENENLKRLNEISSAVSERDMKIWENVAFCICIRKQTEKMKSEIEKMKAACDEKKKENKMLEERLEELTNTITIQKKSLKWSEQSVVMQKVFKDSLVQEANDFRKKYAKTLEMYNDELQEYRSIYEDASREFQDLKVLKIEQKKIEVKKLMLDARIESLGRSQAQYKKIQEQMFYTTMIKLAEYYTTYHKNENLKLLVKEKKQEEQKLLKEHFKLAEAIKEKKRTQKNIPKSHIIPPKEEKPAKSEPKESQPQEKAANQLQKFLDEELLPCSLTSLNCNEKVSTFNKEKSKVRILDSQLLKPPSRPAPAKKPNLDLRKKMEDIMATTKKEIRRNSSFRINNLESQVKNTQEKMNASMDKSDAKVAQNLEKKIEKVATGSQQIIKNVTPIVPKAKPILKTDKAPLPAEESKIVKMPLSSQGNKIVKMPLSSQGNKIVKTPLGSQENKLAKTPSSSKENKNIRTPSSSQEKIIKTPSSSQEKKIKTPPCSQEKRKIEATPGKFNMAFETPKVTNPILKNDVQDNVSKFFNPKKKSVTFQNEEVSQSGGFQLFSMEEKKKVESGVEVKGMNIFRKPLYLETQDIQMKEAAPILPEGDPETEESINNLSFTVETGASNYVNYGSSNDKRSEVTFEHLDSSFNPGFGNLKATPDSEEPKSFNFFSQSKSTNPFSSLF